MIIPVVTGPTASGKTAAVLSAAGGRGVEVVSADAFQVYRGMDIGTAKPSPDELAAVPHHLIDILDPSEPYTAGMFCRRADDLVDEIIGRGNIPVIVGGTGMYVESLTKGMFDGPPRDEAYRARLADIAEERGWGWLYERLGKLDPEYAARIKPTDPARITRALEVRKTLGIPLSEAHRRLHRPPRHRYHVVVIFRPRSALYPLINRRVDEMMAMGWMDEVRRLCDAGYDDSAPGFRAIGYRELAAVVRNDANEAETVTRIKTLTRRFAKRQFTWFGHMPDVEPLDADGGDAAGRMHEIFDSFWD